MKKLKTTRFGEIEIEDDKVVHFESGIPAFEDEHEFAIIPYDDKSPYYFLQSLTTPDLAFLMTLPFLFFPDYSFEIDDANLKQLGVKSQEDIVIYVLVTIPGKTMADATANLVAPVVVNAATMQAKQIVLDKSSYKTNHPLFQKKEA